MQIIVTKYVDSSVSQCVIGAARILSGGALFSLKKVDDLNKPPNLTRPAKKVLKINSCSAWGCTSCPGSALTNFPCKLRLIFSTALGGSGAPSAPPGYAYAMCLIGVSKSTNNN